MLASSCFSLASCRARSLGSPNIASLLYTRAEYIMLAATARFYPYNDFNEKALPQKPPDTWSHGSFSRSSLAPGVAHPFGRQRAFIRCSCSPGERSESDAGHLRVGLRG